MNFIAVTAFLVLSLCGGLVGAVEVGYRYGRRRILNDPSSKDQSLGSIDSSVLGVLGLIVAFTFSGALGRFDQRRELILQEANAIGTAYLRIDLLSTPSQAKLRPLFKDYVRSRIALFDNFENSEIANIHSRRAIQLQNEIWRIVTASSVSTQNPAIVSLALSSVNDMIDITNSRLQATRSHPPTVVYSILFLLAIISALLVGYNMSLGNKRAWFHIIIFAFVISLLTYVTIDLEYPRLGLFKIEIGDKVLMETLESMQ